MGVFDALAAVGSSVIQGVYNNRAIEKTNQANMDLANFQYSKDLEMWNRQNEYNSPQQQMQRFAEAGLNPNLIYGQGNAGNASSAPSYNRPEMRPRHLDLGNIIGLAQLYQDLRLKESATAKNEAAKDSIDLTNEYKRLNNAYTQATQNFRINLAKWNSRNAQVKHAINEFQRDLKKYELEHIFPARESLLINQGENLNLRNSYLKVAPDGTPWFIRALMRSMSRSMPNLDLNKAQKNYYQNNGWRNPDGSEFNFGAGY